MKMGLLLHLLFVANFLQPIEAYNKTIKFTKNEGSAIMSSTQSEGDTLTLAEEGTLSLLLSDMAPEKRIKHLTLQGPINWADLRLLFESEGRLENMESLDLRDVTLVPGGDYYASSSYLGDGTWFTSNELYYLSNERHEERRSDGLSSGSAQYHCYYDYNLAGAFMGTKLKRVVMPKSINEIGRNTFFNSNNLQTVVYDQPPVFVGDRAFYNCKNLTHVPNLDNVTQLEEYAFWGCESLLTGETLNISSLDSIPMKAFTHTMAVDSVVFSKNLHYIGEQAFRDCGLKIFNHDGSIILEQGAFERCKRLQSVTLSDKVESMNYCVFARCPNLRQVNISPSLTRLNADLFYETPWFNSLPFDKGVRYIGNVAMMTDGSQTIEFREGTTAIADYFNQACDVLPDVGTHYPEPIYKTSQCPQNISLPSSLQYIGHQAFKNCPIVNLNLPDEIEEIGSGTFENCQLVTLNLPSSLKTIGRSAFASNTKLMHLRYDVPYVEGQRNGGYYYRYGIFHDCNLLEQIDFGPHVFRIPTSAFSYCKGLVKINMQEGLQSIGAEAFSNCKALREIEIPGSITDIEEEAFYLCSSLLTVRSIIKQPTELKRPFYSDTYNNGTLYVPTGTKEIYEQRWGWKEFKNIVEDESLSVDGVTTDTSKVSAIYNLNGIMSNGQRGLNIVRYSDGTVKKVNIK